MASTPLYKSLKANGTSFYAFPGAQEDISAAYQNPNYKMYFSKYVLLNLPKQNQFSGTQSDPIYFNFDLSFDRSNIATPATNFKDSVIESLRNYVANHEVVMRESRLNNTKYYYDTNALETPTEKIFFKWLKKLNLIDFEPAIPEDEYFSSLAEFRSNDVNNDEFFPETLWKEREITPYDALSFYETANPLYPQKLEIEFGGTTNFRVGDIVNIYNVVDTDIINEFNAYSYYDINLGMNSTVLDITAPGATQGQKIVFDIQFTTTVPVGGNSVGNPYGKVEIVYHRLIQYIGEINGVSNVQEANRSYTEVYAHIPDHTGKTPDILFRTDVDVNYKPNMTFPILPAQYQPEILGAELFNSPIVSTPQNYPGSYFGQFDTQDYTYETSTGDDLRRSGDYFGISGDINNPVTDGSTIDGITIDFDKGHYVKMNIPRRTITNFDQFNAQSTNNEPPKSFEFNAILWYYTVEDANSVVRTNLYGISFLDNPDNNPVDEEIGLRFPTYKKLVSNGQQDGTSYAFNLNLNFNIINDNTDLAYNPEAVNSMFNMTLFNESMKRLSSVNDSFQNIISEHALINQEIMNLKGLLYTQTDINVLNSKISNLESLLRLYSTMQMVDSESISVSTIPGAPPRMALFNIEPKYQSIVNVNTSTMYNEQGAIPYIVGVPQNKTFLINVQNDDQVNLVLPNEDKLILTLDSDLSFKQVVEINVLPSQLSSQNKKLDIYMRSNYTGTQTDVLLFGDINLPVSYNNVLQLPNSSYIWKDFKFDIDFSQSMYLTEDLYLQVPFSGSTHLIYNSIKEGDVLMLNNFFVGTSSVYDFSGQYPVNSKVGPTSSYVIFDVESNKNIETFVAGSQSFPILLHSGSPTASVPSLLSNYPYFSLNKGKKISITRISDSTILSERYHIEINEIM
jgi:hypothetical protein